MFAELTEDLQCMDAPDLTARLRELEVQRRQLDAEMAAIVAEVEARGAHQHHGYRSMTTYLKGELNCSGSEANQLRRRAALLGRFEEIGDIALGGHVATCQWNQLAVASHHDTASVRLPEFVPILLDHAEHLSACEFGKVVAHYIAQADPDGTFDDHDRTADARNASLIVSGGSIDLYAHGGDPLRAEEMHSIFGQAEAVEFDADVAANRDRYGADAPAHALPRTSQQRRFDALYRIFVDSLAATEPVARPEPLVNIVIDLATFGHALVANTTLADPDVLGLGADVFGSLEANLTDRRCETSSGTALHPDAAAQAMVAGRVRRVIVDSDSVVVDLGRERRLFTGKSREAALVLNRLCTRTGCDLPADRCAVDHLDEWSRHGGATDQRNAGPMCRHDNTWKHEQRIRTRRAANGRVYLIRPTGETILPAGAREPSWVEPSPADRDQERQETG